MILRRSMLALVVALAAATTAFAAEGDWAMARYDEAQTGFTPQKLSLPLTHCWQHNTTKSAGNPSTPAVVDGVAYFASGNRVYAVDAATGELKWRYPAAEALGFNIKTGITVGEDLLFFGGTDGNLYALNTADGHIMWRYPTSGSIRSTPVVSGGVLFVGSDDNDLYAIDARSGELFWTSGFRTKDDVQSAPAIAPGLVIFASMDANIYAANIARGNMRWRYQLAVSPVRSAPVVAGNLVYVGVGRVIYALSTKNGQLRYSINLPSDVAAPFAVANEGLYVICRNRKMYAYQVGMIGPKAKWTSAVDIGLTVEAPPTVAGNVIYVGCNHGLICAYSTDDGRLLWNYTITPYAGNKDQRVEYTNVTAPLVVANGSLFALTDDGSLHCFTSSAADNTPPKVSDVTPQTGSAMSGQPPISISATLYDESTGVDPNSIELLLDGERVDHTFAPTTLKVSYETPITQPLRPLRDGRHFLTLLAKDWKGNEVNYIWSFVVDNTMAPKFTPRIPRKETKQPESTKKGVKKPTNPPTAPKEPSGPGGPGGPSGGPPMPPGGPAAPPGPPAPPSGFDGPPPPNMPGYPAR